MSTDKSPPRRRVVRLGALVLALAIPAGPPAVESQALPKVSRVGYLSIGLTSDPRRVAQLVAFRQGLRDLGYVEGRNIAIDARFPDGDANSLPDLAAELVRLRVDIIVAYSTPAAQAARNATKSIPIVMSAVVDPVRTGIVASLARPGGNVTGLSLISPDLVGKQMQLLKELVPMVSRVGILWNPANASNGPQLRQAEAAAQTLGVRLQPMEVRKPDDLDGAFTAMTKQRADAVIVLLDGMFVDQRTRIARLAETTRLPAVYGIKEHAEAGGLLFFGTDLADMNRRAAVFVDKILKGANPADLPVEQPTKFETVINLKAARVLRVTIPQSILIRSNDVIQ